MIKINKIFIENILKFADFQGIEPCKFDELSKYEKLVYLSRFSLDDFCFDNSNCDGNIRDNSNSKWIIRKKSASYYYTHIYNFKKNRFEKTGSFPVKKEHEANIFDCLEVYQKHKNAI